MPSAFDARYASCGRPRLTGKLGYAAVYTAPSGATTACRVRRVPQAPATVETRGAKRAVQRASIVCDAAEVARPVQGGRFTVEGAEVWTIEAAPLSQHGGHACACVRDSELARGKFTRTGGAQAAATRRVVPDAAPGKLVDDDTGGTIVDDGTGGTVIDQ